MNRLALYLALFATAFVVACGGQSTPAPPPPTGGFTNADLKGQYAFSMTGNDGAFFARVGSFIADGNGNITGGLEDINSAAGIGTVSFAASTYSVQADGRGTLTLNGNVSGGVSTRIFSITLVSPTQGLIAETDNIATASGTFLLQTPAAFSQASIANGYVFDFSGIDTSGFPDSIVGQFVSNGGGALTTGLLDENDDAAASGAQAFSAGSYALDATNGSTFGRGDMAFTAGGINYNYLFYIVDASRIFMMEENSNALTVGTATAQAANVPMTNLAFTGSFAMLLGGGGTVGPDARLGRFTSDGNGGVPVSSINFNDNANGDFQTVPKGSVSAATYSIDTANAGTGRGTLTFTDSSLGTYQFIFYMSSATQGVIQDNSTGTVADGPMLAQTGGPFSNANLAGNYAFNWTGVSNNSSTGVSAEEDFVGQLTLSTSSSNNVSGAVDVSEPNSNQGIFLDIVINGNGLTVNGDGTKNNTFVTKLNSVPAVTINFVAIPVSTNTFYVLSSDNTRVTGGTLARQSK